MVKDKIFQIDNGRYYYVLEEVEHVGRKFLLTVECDVAKDELINENKNFVMELTYDNDSLLIKQVEDDNLVKIVTTLLLEKVNESIESLDS